MSKPSSSSATDRVVLACGGRKCCPEVTFELDGSLVLRDDDGERVILNPEQRERLRQELNARASHR